MAKTYNRAIKLCGEPQKVGTPAITVLEYDSDSQVMKAKGSVVPTNGDAGYAKGCRFVKTDGGVATTLYINEGSATVADFNAMETSASTITGIVAGTGLTGDATEGTATLNVVSGTGITANANDVQIAAGYMPTHIVKYAGKITWSGAGTSLATAVNGVAATDIVEATIQTAPAQAAYLVSAAPTTDTITLVLSAANTGNDAVIAYTVFRAVA